VPDLGVPAPEQVYRGIDEELQPEGRGEAAHHGAATRFGYPDGIHRVGPLARLNAADRCGTPEADKELEEYRQRFGRIVQSGFHYHYARLCW
jgi:NAD-reducing hydrogenase large subunit